MRKIIQKITIIFFLAGMSACNYLDTTPPNILKEDVVFSNESSINAYLAKLYSGLLIEDYRMNTSNYDNEHTYYQLEYYTGYAVSMPKNDVLDKTGTGQGIDGTMGFPWFKYDVIRNVNDFIANVQQSGANFSQSKINNWLAEAKTIRAWYYFSMAKRFGGLPIVTEVQDVVGKTNEELMIPRSSEKETWDFIINDLDNAIKGGLSTDNGTGRINKYAAYMLKAQSALYAASIARYSTLLTPELANYTDISTGKQICGILPQYAAGYYQIAYDAADSIIASKKYALARNLDANGSNNFAFLFINPDKHNETILAEYYKIPLMGHRWDYYHLPKPFGTGEYDNPTLNLVDLYDKLDGTSAAVTVGSDGFTTQTYTTVTQLFEGRDYRLGGTVYYPGSNIGDVKFDVRRGVYVNGTLNNGTGTVTVNGQTYTVRGTYGMGDVEQTATSFLCRKYIDENNFRNVSYTNLSGHPWIIMRYAEALMILAESAVELNANLDVAKTALDDIRTRAGLPALNSTADVTLNEVRKQWACEFAFENVNFWNKRRWRTLNETLTNSFKVSGLEPYWDINNNVWKFKKISAGVYPKITFLNKYYYNQISSTVISTNPKIKQNYGY